MGRLGIGLGLAATRLAGVCGAVDTRVTVRARTRDAKFLGTSMGGAPAGNAGVDRVSFVVR